MKSVTAVINRQALVDNLKLIRSKVPESNLVAVVKANAYGHGLVQVARTLEPYVEAFAVARVPEAMELKLSGIKKKIILLEGFLNAEDIPVISEHGFYTAVHDMEQIKAIEQSHISKPINAWLKIDIGMHRLGAAEEEVAKMKQLLESSDKVAKPIGLISHLSVADTPEKDEYNQQQIEYFNKVAKCFSGDICLANSAGIIACPNARTQWVRPGIIMYGISPFADRTGSDLGLTPVMTLKSSLIAMRKVKKGAMVGYGAAWTAPYDTVIGIVAAGYGDGYPRSMPNGTPVRINGRNVPTAGHVCMDMLFVDLGPESTDKIGDEVILWGDGLPVERIATLANTIPYELVCRIMPRVNIEAIN
ncbi:alanine racemase [Anaerobiospirillum succiniciproducens]|uniref:alanine racemase n=1 Tax=Anaerobiospirillum succiniciproducens TaxID=13335 RepID=UPI003F8AE199